MNDDQAQRLIDELREELGRARRGNDLFARVVQKAAIQERSVPVSHFPNYSGIYFLLSGKEVVYVGQSIRLCSRLAGHLAEMDSTYKAKEFDRVAWIECQRDELDLLEAAYVLYYRPRYNRSNGNL